MGTFELNFGGEQMQKLVSRMAKTGWNMAGPGTPDGIIEYLDYSCQKDNSDYMADLVKGLLQPVEIFDEDIFFSQIDLEKTRELFTNS